MLILSMDVGLVNMGIVVARVDNDQIEEIVDCKQIDIRRTIDFCDCELSHDKCMADYLAHLFRDYPFFEKADLILIERQPPQGFVSIQEITNFRFRKKVKMISPNSMHKFFNIGHMNYERRKQFTIEYARKWLNSFDDFQNERNHDISDAFCMLQFHLLNSKEINYNYEQDNIKNFSEFIYVP